MSSAGLVFSLGSIFFVLGGLLLLWRSAGRSSSPGPGLTLSSGKRKLQDRDLSGMTIADVSAGNTGEEKAAMNDEMLDLEVRKFLKNLGINSHQEIVSTIQKAIESGQLSSGSPIDVKMTLEIPALGLRREFERDLGSI